MSTCESQVEQLWEKKVLLISLKQALFTPCSVERIEKKMKPSMWQFKLSMNIISSENSNEY